MALEKEPFVEQFKRFSEKEVARSNFIIDEKKPISLLPILPQIEDFLGKLECKEPEINNDQLRELRKLAFQELEIHANDLVVEGEISHVSSMSAFLRIYRVRFYQRFTSQESVSNIGLYADFDRTIQSILSGQSSHSDLSKLTQFFENKTNTINSHLIILPYVSFLDIFGIVSISIENGDEEYFLRKGDIIRTFIISVNPSDDYRIFLSETKEGVNADIAVTKIGLLASSNKPNESNDIFSLLEKNNNFSNPHYHSLIEDRLQIHNNISSLKSEHCSQNYTEIIEHQNRLWAEQVTRMGIRIAQSDPRRAEGYYTQALRVYPSLGSAIVALGALKANRGLYSAAISLFSKALSLNKDEPNAQKYLEATIEKQKKVQSLLPPRAQQNEVPQQKATETNTSGSALQELTKKLLEGIREDNKTHKKKKKHKHHHKHKKHRKRKRSSSTSD